MSACIKRHRRRQTDMVSQLTYAHTVGPADQMNERTNKRNRNETAQMHSMKGMHLKCVLNQFNSSNYCVSTNCVEQSAHTHT